MATPKKTATPAAKKSAPTRKPAAQRGPTKAAALKALGLSQEDLDTLKLVAQARAEAAADPAPIVQAPVAPQPPVPAPAPAASAEQVFYIRNLRNAEATIRLSRQKVGTDKRLELKPRGQRGDIVRVQREDLNDDQLLANVGLLIEILPAGEAQDIISKQVVNAQTQIHPSMAMLRNELGKEYAEGSLKVDAEYNSQGVVVATLDPAQMQGQVEDRSVSKGQPVQRVQPGQATLGGNPAIVSDGFAAQNSDMAADAIARRKDLEGPAAGLGGVRVVVDQPHRVV